MRNVFFTTLELERSSTYARPLTSLLGSTSHPPLAASNPAVRRVLLYVYRPPATLSAPESSSNLVLPPCTPSRLGDCSARTKSNPDKSPFSTVKVESTRGESNRASSELDCMANRPFASNRPPEEISILSAFIAASSSTSLRSKAPSRFHDGPQLAASWPFACPL